MTRARPVIRGHAELARVEDIHHFKVYRCTKPWHPQPCWHTKCIECNEVVTAFDFSATESLEIAQGHECKDAGAGAP